MIPVILETPYAGDVPQNLAYLRACIRDCLLRGEAPFASHGLYTQPGVLRDEVVDERERGILAGFAWRALARKTAFYTNLGWSSGMVRGRDAAKLAGLDWETRALADDWFDEYVALERQGAARQYWSPDGLSAHYRMALRAIADAARQGVAGDGLGDLAELALQVDSRSGT